MVNWETRSVRRRGWGAAFGAFAVVIGSIVGATAPAHAAEYDYPAAIDPSSIVVTTEDGSGTVTVNERLRIDASWSVPDGATAGQTFGFTLPSEFAGWASSFTIPAEDDPTSTVAECTVSKDDAPVVTCTLTDYVDGRTNLAGSLWFLVSAAEQTAQTAVEFVVDGTTTPVSIPGSGIVRPSPPPAAPAKWSWEMADGRIGWQLSIPGAVFEGSESITIDDTLDPAGDGRAAHRNIDGSLQVWSTDLAGDDRQNVSAWQGEWDAAGTAFHLVIPGPIDATRQYVVRYYTVPTQAERGDVFGNTADIGGTVVHDTQVWTASGGGTGTGGATGSFSLAKILEGSATEAVPAGTTFSVDYTYGDPLVRQTLAVTVGEPAPSIPLPNGTVVTLEEIDLPAVDGVTWGSPSFSGTGVRVRDDGRADVTIVGGTVVNVILTNVAEPLSPPVPVTPEEPQEPEVPGAPRPPTELPLTESLASTGGEAPNALLWASGLSVLLGLGLIVAASAQRRRRERP
ncbi:Ig-like domain-containing protein [Microbacterium paraoxydans]|uniref:Ig-like domain-containing protein n=1 Tax=Microbacterium paraoxydans TaxID=199592 RepID=UPI001CFB0C36|nr:Ig-like domain-containing protein [Microbacterium paraoxydans]